ncbi:MAG: LacI family transcriptional regulator [Tissierellia bacterium]|nr:LacI family transcriptional regulator [Tissierellia bacterium]
MSSPTIKDVAKLAGVSISTVSRVMNDSKPVSPEARKKVLDAIKKLDFKPNEVARSLVMRRSNLIGVVVEDIGISYMAQMVRGIEEIGRMYKYDILLSSTYGDIETEKKIIDFMFTKQVEGIILITERAKPEIVYKLKEQSAPFILLDKFYNVGDIHTVTIDYVQAVENMVKHLNEEGHENIIFVSADDNTNVSKDKLKGIKAAQKDFGVNIELVDVNDIRVKPGYEAGDEIMKVAKENNSTAVFLASDDLAVGFMNYCYEKNIRIPDDISVAGFGDLPTSKIFKPTLTTVQEPLYDIGAVSMRKLVKELKEKTKITQTNVLPTQIMKRESVAKINK